MWNPDPASMANWDIPVLTKEITDACLCLPLTQSYSGLKSDWAEGIPQKNQKANEQPTVTWLKDGNSMYVKDKLQVQAERDSLGK